MIYITDPTIKSYHKNQLSLFIGREEFRLELTAQGWKDLFEVVAEQLSPDEIYTGLLHHPDIAELVVRGDPDVKNYGDWSTNDVNPHDTEE